MSSPLLHRSTNYGCSVLLVLFVTLAVAQNRLRGEDSAPRAVELLRELEKYSRPPPEFAGKLGPYHSPLEFSADVRVQSPREWTKRRQEIAETWRRRLGAWPPLVQQPTVKRLESVDRDGYTEHHVQVQVSAEGHVADGYLLIPNGPGFFPAVLIPFYEPLTSIGRGMKGQGTHDYGLQLVRRGFVTLSIGTPGAVEKIGKETRDLLTEAGVEQRLQPLTLLAYVAANCHTALARMPEVDAARIGIVGLSYGGKWSMFASCLQDKFACAVWSDPGIVFNEKNGNVNYWEPWYLGYDPQTQRKPGIPSESNPRTGLYKELVEQGEDLVSLHALMAPRPVLVSGGTEDPPTNWQALNHLVAVNQLLGYQNRVAMTARQGHIPTPAALEIELAFLEYWLKYNTRALNDPPAGFVALFNGQDLTGWRGGGTENPLKRLELAPEDRAEKDKASIDDIHKHWRIENGELVNDGTGQYLTTEKDFGDFELRLEYKTVPKADSGIYLRGIPQVQIWDYTKAGGKWDRNADKGSGGLFNNPKDSPGQLPSVLADKPFGEWNSFRITMVGEIVSVTLNDKLVVDHAPLHNYFDKGQPLLPVGPIQLQTHGGEIRWRNVFLREIPRPPSDADKLSEGKPAGEG